MRAAIVIVLITLLSCQAIVWPWVGLLTYIWFSLMRPDYFSWSQGLFPYSVVIEAFVLLGSVRLLPRIGVLFSSPMALLFLALHGVVGVSVLAAQNRSLCFPYYTDFIRMSVMALLIPMLIDSERRLFWLFSIITFSLGAVAVKFGVYGFREGGVAFTQGYAGLDNNGIALAFVMLLPFCWYLRKMVSAKWLKMTLVGVIVCALASIMMSGSRSASLTLGVVVLIICLRSRRKTLAFVGLGLLMVPAIAVYSSNYVRRMSTISDYGSDNSIQSRLTQFRTAVEMWKDYPLVGVGFGNDNYMALEHRYLDLSELGKPLKVHNSYLQLLVDSGIFAAFLYVAMIVVGVLLLQGSIQRASKHYPHLIYYPYTLQASILAYAQFGLSGGKERYDFGYYVFMTIAAWLLIEKNIAAASAAGARSGVAARPVRSSPVFPPPPAPVPAGVRQGVPPPESGIDSRRPSAPSGPRRKLAQTNR